MKARYWIIVLTLFLVPILGAFFLLVKTEANVPSIFFLKKRTVDLSQYPTDLIVAPARYEYEVVEAQAPVRLLPGEVTDVHFALRNTGNVVWSNQGVETPFYLGLSRPNDRDSVFYAKDANGWASTNRVAMSEDMVYPGELAHFAFTVTAPDTEAIYIEYFRPVLDGVEWLRDKGISVEVTVAGDNQSPAKLTRLINGMPDKYIKVDLSDQRLYAYEGGLERYVFVTSTGLIGMDTPTGEFQIHNKYPTAYSEPYDLYMDNWMAFTPDGVYGLHSLPFWKFKDGSRLYEGEDHLGTPVSHGCIRTGITQSKVLYDWAEVGTAVIITQ